MYYYIDLQILRKIVIINDKGTNDQLLEVHHESCNYYGKYTGLQRARGR